MRGVVVLHAADCCVVRVNVVGDNLCSMIVCRFCVVFFFFFVCCCMFCMFLHCIFVFCCIFVVREDTAVIIFSSFLSFLVVCC